MIVIAGDGFFAPTEQIEQGVRLAGFHEADERRHLESNIGFTDIGFFNAWAASAWRCMRAARVWFRPKDPLAVGGRLAASDQGQG
jgi:hypothetical protein